MTGAQRTVGYFSPVTTSAVSAICPPLLCAQINIFSPSQLGKFSLFIDFKRVSVVVYVWNLIQIYFLLLDQIHHNPKIRGKCYISIVSKIFPNSFSSDTCLIYRLIHVATDQNSYWPVVVSFWYIY